jgi:hypothetical protein
MNTLEILERVNDLVKKWEQEVVNQNQTGDMGSWPGMALEDFKLLKSDMEKDLDEQAVRMFEESQTFNPLDHENQK